ncbi:hypothetical protein HWV62_7982, partial [Athelia sp. TMB]
NGWCLQWLDSATSEVNSGFQEVRRRGGRLKKTDRMAQDIAQELLNSDGEPEPNTVPQKPWAARKPGVQRRSRKLPGGNSFDPLTIEEASDADDDDYQSGSDVPGLEGPSDEDSDSDDEVQITNSELADALPRKTVAERGPASHHQTRKADKKRKQPAKSAAVTASSSKRARVEDALDDDDELPAAPGPGPVQSKAFGRKNPVYYFYEEVQVNAAGEPGQRGDKHFKCYHGSRKTLTVTKAMHFSLNGLILHLKTHFPHMHRLYAALKARDTPATDEEKAIASGRKVLDTKEASEYLAAIEAASGMNIPQMFNQQQQDAANHNWDQKEFETRLSEWIATCDQPFDEVEKPEFRRLLEYTHTRSIPLHIPHRGAVRKRVMKMGEDTVDGIKKMISVSDLI